MWSLDRNARQDPSRKAGNDCAHVLLPVVFFRGISVCILLFCFFLFDCHDLKAAAEQPAAGAEQPAAGRKDARDGPDLKMVRGRLLNELGRELIAEKEYGEAETRLKSALEELTASLGWNNQLVAECLSDLIQAYAAQRKLNERKEAVLKRTQVAIAIAGPCPQDEAALVDWLANAEQLGHPSAATIKGLALLEGRVSPPNPEQARLGFMRSLNHLDGCGAVNLGLLHLDGRGTARDLDRANKYLDFAARKCLFYPSTGSENNARAQYRLGLASLSGRGLAKRADEAYLWLSLAAESDSSVSRDAGERLAKLKRSLPPSAVCAYEKKIEAWKERQSSLLPLLLP